MRSPTVEEAWQPISSKSTGAAARKGSFACAVAETAALVPASSQLQGPSACGSGHAVLVTGGKEMETVPQSWLATGDQFFATARMECSVFGGMIVEHAANSSNERPRLLTHYFVVVSTILDHTTLRTCQLARLLLSKKRSPQPWTGTTIHFGCEKHFKSCVDRLFGWCRGCLRRWLDKKTDILTVEHLVSALQTRTS